MRLDKVEVTRRTCKYRILLTEGKELRLNTCTYNANGLLLFELYILLEKVLTKMLYDYE
jgi:hypothetical protein